MKKRALSLLLALLLAASLLPTTALAAPDPDGCVDINEENFPDANFRTYLRDNIAHSGYADLYFTPAQLAAVKGIKAFRREIGDLTGIEYFTGLSSLYCEENQLTSLDVS